MTNPITPSARTVDGKLVARLILLILGTFGAIALAMVFGITWVFSSWTHRHELEDGAAIGGLIGVILFALLIPPLVFGVSSSYAFERTGMGARRLAQWLWGMTGVQLIAVIGVVVFAVTTPTPTWIPITVISCAIVFTAVGFVLGARLRSAPVQGAPVAPFVALPPMPAWWRDPVVYIAAGLFLVVLIAGLVLTRPWSIAAASGHEAALAASGSLLAVDIACICALIPCLVRIITSASRLKSVTGGNYAQAARMRRVIMGKRGAALESGEGDRAIAVAVALGIQFRWQIAFYSLLYVAIACGSLSTHFVGGSSFSLWLAGVVVVIGIVAITVLVFSLVKVRRFLAAEHTAQAPAIA